MRVADRSRTTLFLPLAIGLLSLALSGFWFTYWRPLFAGGTLAVILHVHGVLWFGWFVLLVIQARLIRSGKTQLHRVVGTAGVPYTGLLVVVSSMVAVQAIARDAHLLTQSIETVPTIIPLTQIVMFTVFFGLAVARLQQPEAHKRLIILAALVAVTPALARISIGVLGAPNIPLIFTVSTLLIVLVAYLDWRRTGRLHSVYLWGGIAILTVRVLRIPLAMSPAWSALARQMSGVLSPG